MEAVRRSPEAAAADRTSEAGARAVAAVATKESLPATPGGEAATAARRPVIPAVGEWVAAIVAADPEMAAVRPRTLGADAATGVAAVAVMRVVVVATPAAADAETTAISPETTRAVGAAAGATAVLLAVTPTTTRLPQAEAAGAAVVGGGTAIRSSTE